jgi:DNA-binding MarR family transcriptional regulator
MAELSRPLVDENDSFLHNIGQLNKAMARRLSPRLAAHGLDFATFMLLKKIDQGMVHPSALAGAFQMPPSLISRHVDRLVELGLVERRLDPVDLRRIRLALRPPAAALLADAGRTVRDLIAPLLGQLPVPQREQFLETLAVLAGRLNKE